MSDLKELFAKRDATQPGSPEEDEAVKAIMAEMFPQQDGGREGPGWDFEDVDVNWMGLHLWGETEEAARAGFLESIHPDHRDETDKRIGKITRID
jgi:hypothetical protein